MKFQYFTCVKASSKSDMKVGMSELFGLLGCDDMKRKVDEYRRTGDADIKKSLPCITPMGECRDGETARRLECYVENGLAMIDLDHLDFEDAEAMAPYAGLMDRKLLAENHVVMAYKTVSGNGLRIVFNRFKGTTIKESCYCFLLKMGVPTTHYDEACVDITRLSILVHASDVIYMAEVETEDGEACGKVLQPEVDAELLAKARALIENGGEGDGSVEKEQGSSTAERASGKGRGNGCMVDSENVPFKKYGEAQILENDKLYGDFEYFGRKVKSIVEIYVKWKTNDKGPQHGQRHNLYNHLCKNFRNVVDNDPRMLHAVLPLLGHTTAESWKQCVYFCQVNKSDRLEKSFWKWMFDRGLLEAPSPEDDNEEESEETRFYREMIDRMPPLPPVIKEYVRIAPLWFKMPVISTLQAYLGLLATNYRMMYFDDTELSTSFYNLIYAPAASGKSYIKRLKVVLDHVTKRDDLAMAKQLWYDAAVRRAQNSGSKSKGNAPEEPKVKFRLFASRTSIGEIMTRQADLGEHHWLQDVAEFSIWSSMIKKDKEASSAFYRVAYENDYYAQSFKSANSWRGRVRVFPIIHATCTLGQIKSFFTNLEDGLLTRFSFTPILNQKFAKYQPWKMLSTAEQQRIEKTLERLEHETYTACVCDKDVRSLKEEDLEDKGVWDYEFQSPKFYDMEYVNKALLDWMEKERQNALKSDNEALDQARKRVARNAGMYGLLCRALWGRDDKRTRELIVRNVLWEADRQLYNYRYLWEVDLNNELKNANHRPKGARVIDLYDDMAMTFTKEELGQLMTEKGVRSQVGCVISNWKNAGLIKEIQKRTYQKVK